VIKAVIFDCFGVVLDVFRSTKRPQIISLIEELKPNYKVAMLTNVSGRRSLDQRFEAGELDQMFDLVVASGDVGFEKPSRDIYRMTAEKLGVEPAECVFIDDIQEFVTAAEQFGMRGIHHVDDDVTIAELTTLLKEEHERKS
jgi:putative hydrolase of the HAD superfamily